MKANEILNQCLKMNCTEQQGKAVSGLFETFSEFVTRWLGEDANIIAGGFKNDAEYLSTTFVECPNGHREGTFEGVFARVDGGELKRLEAQGIKLVINTWR